MTHPHDIVDYDPEFTINPSTRTIIPCTTELSLVQGDHRSERYTFTMPRMIEGHDMASTNRVEIHYNNVAKSSGQVSRDVYYVTDGAEAGEQFIFSWLLTGQATMYAGSLNFSITFVCFDENNEITYEWSTTTFEGITILSSNRNTPGVEKEFSDSIEQLKDSIIDELETGAQGPKGDKGDRGETGPSGDDGKSAYQYAQDGGYTGTEEDFAELMASGVSTKYDPTTRTLDFTIKIN